MKRPGAETAAFVPVMPKTWPTVVHMLADAAARNPNGEALVCGDVRLSYADYAACGRGLRE